ncbi:MAG TPA: hypothetical protein PLX68_01655 [Dermatophilaceae bacterium]|nr:hypothetical protein [Dermatophilaceae bacterium]
MSISTLWRRVAPWLTPVLVAVEIVLVVSGVLSIGKAVLIAAAVELLLAVTVVSRLVVASRRYRSRRQGGVDRWQAAEDALAEVVPRRLARFILLEPRLWLCLLGQVRRHRPNTSTFRYDGGLRALLTVTIVLVIVEGIVVDGLVALLAPDSVWLWVVLGAHVYGLVMLVALRTSFATHPHQVTPTGLHLHDGIFSTVDIPYSAIRAIRSARQHYFGRSGLKIDRARQQATLAFGDTTVEVELDPDQSIAIDGRITHTSLGGIRISVDEPDRLVNTVRGQAALAT